MIKIIKPPSSPAQPSVAVQPPARLQWSSDEPSAHSQARFIDEPSAHSQARLQSAVPAYMFEKRANVTQGWAVLGVLRSGITKWCYFILLSVFLFNVQMFKCG